MQEQDSNEPSGIRGRTSGSTGATGNSVSRARQRKSNAAIQLALAGANWDEIALSLGYPTARTARVATERALEKQLSRDDDRAAMRKFANARLERLLRGVWAKAIDPDHPEHLLAVTKAKELIDRHIKLYGLDAPTEVVIHSPTQHELEQWVARVTTMLGPDVAEYDILEGEVIDAQEA
jgi:hypothetical protein